MSRELYSIDAEYAVLGVVMQYPQHVDDVLAMVQTRDFHDLANAALYNAILATHAAGLAVDAVTVGIEHPTLPNGDSMLAYAGDIAKNTPSAANIDAFVRVVLERSALRRVVAVADVIRDSAHDDRPVAEIIAMAQQATADLRDLDGEMPDYQPVSHYVLAAVNNIDAKREGRAPVWQTTGLSDLDQLMQGLRPKKVTVIVGLPGSGKTTLGLQIAQHNAVQAGKPWLVFSLEMPGEELGVRTIASLGGVHLRRLDNPAKLADDDWARMTAVATRVSEAPLYISDDPGLTPSRIRSIARKCQREHGLAGVVVDYLGLVKGDARGRSRSEEVGQISKAMLRLAKELDIPVIELAQLNRDSTKRVGKKPQSSDLRDSGEIEADASCILMVHRDMDTEEGQNGVTQILMTKCRHAKVGDCLLQQEGQYGRFVDFKGAVPSDEEVEMGRPFSAKYHRMGHA
ncbi:replicative DNA helicase [Pseudomonas typographi]|uniref:replicative DNA helicase n=1 Tax=Pseudomonas typographi TaxID=2715964 RepID=UPI00168425B7|nr:DnaB-like helicase C-terminal domain-containing protein [Pseudomonas typographi]MBD1586711.1 AAA family ATPase [Pseudomonas typographi]